jgi:hypothetical protein
MEHLTLCWEFCVNSSFLRLITETPSVPCVLTSRFPRFLTHHDPHSRGSTAVRPPDASVMESGLFPPQSI